MILDEKQRMHVRNVRTATLAYRKSKSEALARAKSIALAEVDSYLNAMDHEIRQAFAAGVPKLQIRRDGMGTSDSRTLEESLARSVATAELAAELERDHSRHRFRLGEHPRTVVVTLSGEELTATMDKFCDHEEQLLFKRLMPSEYAEAILEVITRRDGSPYASPVTSNSIGASYARHPVVYWAAEEVNQQAVLAWYEKQSPEASLL